jgi:hypothetical protein
MTMKSQVLFLLCAAGVFAQIPGMDMAVMQKWSRAKVIRFQVEGVHKARTGVVFGDYEGKADVTDRMTVEYVFNNKTGKIVGEPKIVDFPSETVNIKADGTNCPPPQLKGAYEHFKMVKSAVMGTQIQTGNKNMAVAADRQSFMAAGAENWSWTYRPTVVE